MFIDQRHRDKENISKSEVTFIVIVSLIFLFMMMMEIITNYEPRKLSALLFVIFWIPLLFIHEFGHAIMAKVPGWRVNRVVIGFGKVLVRTRLLGALMEIRTIPLEGFVQISPESVELARVKHALIYFAGPGIELFLFFSITFVIGGFDQLLTINNDYERIALQSFASASLVGAVINLIPIGIITKEGNSPNDGMGIILCLFSSQIDYESWANESNKE